MFNTPKNKKTTRFFSTPLFFMASIAITVLSFIGMTKAHMFAQTVTADPSIGYAPDANIAGLRVVDWVSNTPVLWPIPLLFTIIIAIARIRDEWTLGVVMTWSSLAFTAIFLLVRISETVDAKEDTFSTWAEQRYGIEIEMPPYDTLLPLTRNRHRS